MTYGDFKDLAGGTISHKVSRNKAFNIVKNPKYDGYQRGLTSIAYEFFDRRSISSDVAMLQNEQLAEELHKPIVKKIKRRKVYSSFKGNIWDVELADMQLIMCYYGEIKEVNFITDD